MTIHITKEKLYNELNKMPYRITAPETNNKNTFKKFNDYFIVNKISKKNKLEQEYKKYAEKIWKEKVDDLTNEQINSLTKQIDYLELTTSNEKTFNYLRRIAKSKKWPFEVDKDYCDNHVLKLQFEQQNIYQRLKNFNSNVYKKHPVIHGLLCALLFFISMIILLFSTHAIIHFLKNI